MSNEYSDCEEQAASILSINVSSQQCEESKQSAAAVNLEEEPVGNVSKFVAYPQGSKEKLRKGYLMFHACFQSGNLGRVDCISDFEYDLFVRPDTCNPRYRVWFYFTVQNVHAGQKVIFNIVNFSKTKSLYRDGMSPLVKSTSRPKWQRIPAKNVFYYRSPDHHKNYVMSFAFAFDKESDVYQFSYCYPYTYNRLQTYLHEIEKKNFDYIKIERICLSVQQRNIDLLTITSPKNLLDTKKRVVFFTARVHPGETPSSYVCQGIIDFLVSSHPIAQVLRDHIVFMIVPMLNPDGVVLGNYRCSLMGFDLNRFWQEPSPWAHPSILATKQLLMDMNEDADIDLDFYIDLHAHSTAMNGFMYGNIYDEEDRFEDHSVYPRLLCSNAEDFSFTSSSFNKDAIKAGTGRRTLGSCLSEQSNCYTLEVSFFSYLSNTSTPQPYTEDAYLKLGRNVARTFLDYYKLNALVAQRLNFDILNYERMYDNRKISDSKQNIEKVESKTNRNVKKNSYTVAKKNVSIELCDAATPPVHKSQVLLRMKHRTSKN